MTKRQVWQKRFLAAFLVLGFVATLLWALGYYGHVSVNPSVLVTVWRSALVAFLGYTLLSRSLTAWILLGMMIGAEVGYDLRFFSDESRLRAAANLQVLSQIFLRLIRTIVAPLIFGTLVVGIAGHANLKQVGRMGIKSLIYFEVITTLALFIGLAAINISQAGAGISPQTGTTAALPSSQPEKATDIILKVFPENIAKAVAEGQVLQVVVFSIIFAIALGMVSEARRRPMLAFCESLSETMFKFTNIVMYFAPIAVAGAMAYTVGTMGLDVLGHLAKLLATLYAALIVFVLCVLLPAALMARLPLKRFIQAVAEPVSIAFSTASSEAALPRAMESMEAFGAPRQVVAFVLPTGYSFNLDGSTLYLAMASMFVVQAAGLHLPLSRQLVIMLTLMLTSKGVAGVPRAMLVILMGTVASFDLPSWPVLIIFGVDQLMDMARTATNVLGNCLATAVIARWEGVLSKEAPSDTLMDAVAQ